ncbi:hypothetical protein HYC85_002382 [Camellia sinensis]|uniref:Uncharacterized protein n=1 Tax=Camellia sinensis TaxID=4442 RepID=A0A7J7I822_CAMSI|nr:hypothetical protein HYC85_002382 [Camellia sinensis]
MFRKSMIHFSMRKRRATTRNARGPVHKLGEREREYSLGEWEARRSDGVFS